LEVNEYNLTEPMGQIKSVLIGKFIAMRAYIKKTERSQINLMTHLKLLEKQEQANPKTNRREIIKVRAEINKIETKKTIQRINETKSWFFEKTNKHGRPLANLTKMRREKTQISRIRNAKGEVKTNTWKSRKSSETTLRTYIQINLKILKKWTDF
jgi:hypothetical protein